MAFAVLRQLLAVFALPPRESSVSRSTSGSVDAVASAAVLERVEARLALVENVLRLLQIADLRQRGGHDAFALVASFIGRIPWLRL
jgi:hypothetical protein